MDQYVIVTIADNGVVHVWGDDNSQPFNTRSAAIPIVGKMKIQSAITYGTNDGVKYKICKLLGKPPQ